MKQSVDGPQWRKSSYSGGDSGQCVEVAALGGAVGIRDSKDLTGGHLVVGRTVFAGLVRRVKGGELGL